MGVVFENFVFDRAMNTCKLCLCQVEMEDTSDEPGSVDIQGKRKNSPTDDDDDDDDDEGGVSHQSSPWSLCHLVACHSMMLILGSDSQS